MNEFFKKIKILFSDISKDTRMPVEDKKILLGMLILIVSPIDFIPDWIPLYGLLDDFLFLALISNYLFSVIDQSIILSHYPWGMKSFARIRRIAGIFSMFVPNFIGDNLWKYTKDPF
jgi:uncharacterized membrane protein YkvA (DUF1232 family)